MGEGWFTFSLSESKSQFLEGNLIRDLLSKVVDQEPYLRFRQGLAKGSKLRTLESQTESELWNRLRVRALLAFVEDFNRVGDLGYLKLVAQFEDEVLATLAFSVAEDLFGHCFLTLRSKSLRWESQSHKHAHDREEASLILLVHQVGTEGKRFIIR